MIAPEIGEHAVFALRAQQQRLDRDSQRRDNGLQFLRNALGIRDVGDDEPGHVRQRSHRLREAASSGLLEVKHHGAVAVLPKLPPNRIQHCLALRRESAENQHDLRRDRVDHVADLLVVQQ